MKLLRLLLLLIAVASLAGAHEGTAAAPLPNVVVVMVDDMPQLDGRLLDFMPATKALMAQGITFTDFHSETPLCCPARAGFLTGQHTLNHGQIKNGSTLFKPAMTIATQLHGLGYHTAIVGKYLNNYQAEARFNRCVPGWDDFLVFGDPAYSGYNLYGNCSGTPVATQVPTYSTDYLRDRAVNFMHAAPAGQPLFEWVAVFAPHAPITPAARYASAPQCNSLAPWKPPNYNNIMANPPAYVAQQKPLSSKVGWKGTGVCRTLLAVDDLVAALRDELQAQGRLSNTIFVFTGDNGMSSGEHRLAGKQAPYETGIPFYMTWPDGWGTAPRTISERVQNIDFAPTICEIAGCTLGPYPNGQQTPDGKSYLGLIDGTDTDMGRDAVLEDLPYAVGTGCPAWYGIETTALSPLGRWLYVEYDSGERELYDAVADRWTMNNVAGDPSNASLVAALHTRLAELKAEKGT